ncbi:hypothetical protein SAMN05421788_105137 [Filimonas lacunae]|uniref:Uncharacterized protein n=2 Tax=Filimonas lacunae TaxID=477680 RepID=A0A173MD52_9BACT|nr:hypothetical protein FLA_1416 [Filimonas lacunae]SIT21349.1 hypothetical protein SAMN05421788_105137 [Filimonas lacunae]
MACSKSNSKPDEITTPPIDTTPPVVTPTDTTPSTKYDITQLNNTLLFETTPVITVMARQDYNELSGAAASQLNAGILYMHNDAKNSPVIITNAKGEDLGRIVLDNVSTTNPEDICVGPGPVSGKTYIYLADIGDNKSTRTSITVYRFEEPVITGPNAQTEIHITATAAIALKYPSYAYNAEALLVDPITKDLFIATKEIYKSTIYKAAYPQSTTSTTTLVSVVKTPFDLLTSGDISANGSEILLRNKSQIWYWKRDTTKSIAETLLTAPEMAPYAGNEHQGEGICFAADNTGYYTNTEIRDYSGAVSNISFYKRK